MPKHVRGHSRHHTVSESAAPPDAARWLPLFWIGHKFGGSIYPPGWTQRWSAGEFDARVFLIYAVIGGGFLLMVFGCAALATLIHLVLNLL